MDPVSYLFDSTVFTPRAACGPGWSDWLIASFQIAETTIATAYLWIAAVLVRFWYVRRAAIPKPAMLFAFGAFIFLCGLTHICGLIAFHAAPYRFFLLVWAATALVSMATATTVLPAARYVAKLPSPEEFRKALAERDAADALAKTRTDQLVAEFERQGRRAQELRQELDETRQTIAGLQTKADSEVWRGQFDTELKKIREHLHHIRGAI